MLKSTARTLIILLLFTPASLPNERPVQGIYRNQALGFSVKIPTGLKAVAGDQAGPERGVRIVLPSAGTLVVYGEPNSQAWKSPAEGLRYELGQETELCRASSKPASSHYVIYAARVGEQEDPGRLIGSEGAFTCAERFVKIILVFRPDGDPIYWFRLITTVGHETEASYLDSIAHSFTLIPSR
jgi:hypothetical protein